MQAESPRMLGILEHQERVQFFLDLAQNEAEMKANHRLMLAAIYSCRAIVELMLEAAEKQELTSLKSPDPKQNRKVLESDLIPRLPYYYLVERIRIHDFHRFGIAPPSENVKKMILGGPAKMRAEKGAAAMSVTDSGLQQMTSGNSKIELQRPLLINDGEYFDDASSAYVKIRNIVENFFSKVPDVISHFRALCA